METRNIWLQLFGGEGAGAGAGDGAAASGEGNAPDAGESKLLELGVPAEKLKKHRASRERMAARKSAAQPEQAAAAQEEETPPQPTEEAPDEGKEPKERSVGIGSQFVNQIDDAGGPETGAGSSGEAPWHGHGASGRCGSG